MGWRETCAVDERMSFMIAAEKREEPFLFSIARRAMAGLKRARVWIWSSFSTVARGASAPALAA